MRTTGSLGENSCSRRMSKELRPLKDGERKTLGFRPSLTKTFRRDLRMCSRGLKHTHHLSRVWLLQQKPASRVTPTSLVGLNRYSTLPATKKTAPFIMLHFPKRFCSLLKL